MSIPILFMQLTEAQKDRVRAAFKRKFGTTRKNLTDAERRWYEAEIKRVAGSGPARRGARSSLARDTERIKRGTRRIKRGRR